MVTKRCPTNHLVVEDGEKVLSQRLAQLNKLRKSRHFCDVVLQVEFSEIHAHRAVLACASPFFFELFMADDEGKNVRDDKVLYKLNSGFDKEALEKLVDYCYTGYLEVPQSITRNIYICANKLKMESVVSTCGDFLIDNLTPENCLSVRTIPGIASNLSLVQKIDQFIQSQKDLLEVTRESLNIPKIQLKVIHSTKEEGAAITSRAVSSLALEWLHKQVENEECEFTDLQGKEHLLYLNLDNSLHDCLDIEAGSANDSELVQDYKKVSRKLSQTGLKVRRKLSSSIPQPVKPRMLLYSRSISDTDEQIVDAEWKVIAHSHVSDNFVLAIATLRGFVVIISIMQHIDTSCPSTPKPSRPGSVEKVDSYTVIPNMASPKCACGTGNLNGELFVSGGYDRGECLKSSESYCPSSNTWRSLPDMHQGRGRFNLTVLDGKAYAVGGSDGSQELNSVEVYDGTLRKWIRAASLPLARSNAGVCSLDSKIYCIGGWNGHVGIKQCEAYDPKLNEWQTIAPLNIGGSDAWNCLNSVEVYYPELSQWKFSAPMNVPRRGCGAAVINGKLYIMGGSDGVHSLCSTEIYEPETNTWTSGPPMTNCRANVSATVVGDRIYAVGGFSGKTFLNSIEYLDPESNEWTNFTPKPGQNIALHSRSCGRLSQTPERKIGPLPEVEVTTPDSGSEEEQELPNVVHIPNGVQSFAVNGH